MSSTYWTLWQRMPTRYQLTVRTPDNIDEGFTIEGEGFRSPRTPRQTTRDASASVLSPKSTNSDVSPRESEGTPRSHNRKSPCFPNRKSGYIDHFKTQQRVNSARMKMVSDPSSFMKSPRSRAKTAPSGAQSNSSFNSRPTSTNTSTSYAGRMQDLSNFEKIIREKHGKHDAKVPNQSSVFNFEDDNFALKIPNSEKDFKKYIIQETEGGTMYIDNGKIFFYKKHRHNMAHYIRHFPSQSESGGFLASIRHEYLKKPKHIALQGQGRNLDPRFLQRQRIDYNRKAGHILDYYSGDDEDRISMDDIAKFTKFQPADLWRGCGSRHQSRLPKSAKVRKLRFSTSMPDIENSEHSISPDYPDDPSEYLKLNTQSKLHDRSNFYLRTPGFRMVSPANPIPSEIENCQCGMCRLEMLMAHFGASMTQLPGMYNPEQGVPNIMSTDMGNTQQPQNPTIHTKGIDQVECETKEEKSKLNVNSERKMDENKSVKKVSEQKLTITVPAMNIEKETSDLTTTESVLDTARVNEVSDSDNKPLDDSRINDSSITGSDNEPREGLGIIGQTILAK